LTYLVTGAGGFLGASIVSHLETLTEVKTLGLESDNDIVANVAEEIPPLPESDVVVHAAGLAHMIPKTAEEKQSFLDVNYQGTVNLCRALEKANVKSGIQTFVFISSVSVYGLDQGVQISEDAELLGDTPYAKSKILAETFLKDWTDQHRCNLIILRLPLIIGSKPVGNLAKLIAGIKSRKYLNIGGGEARKSMVLAKDVAELIGRIEGHSGIFNLTDLRDPSFKEISGFVSQKLGLREPLNIPMFVARLLGWTGDVLDFFPVNTDMVTKMTSDLTFDSSRAVKNLGWQPRSVIKNFDIVFE